MQLPSANSSWKSQKTNSTFKSSSESSASSDVCNGDSDMFFYPSAFDILLDESILELSDKDPTVNITLDPDQFVRFLKNLDPNRWDPLPCNIT